MRPFIIEFTGTPEAGKTTTIHKVKEKLLALNFTVNVLQESAEILPKEFPKGSWDAHLWMSYTTCSKLLVSKYLSSNLVLVDRGSISSRFFGLKHFNSNACTLDDYTSFLNTFTEQLNPDFLISLICTPDESLRRKGGPGRIVTHKFITDYNNLFATFYDTLTIPKALIETSNLDVDEVTQRVFDIIINQMKAR